MPINNANVAIILLLATNIFTYIGILALIKEVDKQQNRNKKLCDMTNYMSKLLDEHGIPLSEFDSIVLNSIVEEYNADK